MKDLPFAEFCSLIDGQIFEVSERLNNGWQEVDGYSYELLSATYIMRTPELYTSLGERKLFSFEVRLWVNMSRCAKAIVSFNQCGYFKDQEHVLIEEDKIRRLREILKSGSR